VKKMTYIHLLILVEIKILLVYTFRGDARALPALRAAATSD